MTFTEYPIHVDQLCPGVYIRLDQDDTSSRPFFHKSFKIKDQRQIDKIKAAGITTVTCILDKSDTPPLRHPRTRETEVEEPAKERESEYKTPVSKELLGLKRETIERNKARKKAFAQCEKRYDSTMTTVATLMRRVSGRSDEAAAMATELVQAMVSTFLDERDVVLNLMSTKPKDELKNYHALNVTVMSLMIGREFRLGPERMAWLGMGALFHDLGRGRIPLNKVGKVTSIKTASEKFYELHPQEGAKIARDLASFPQEAIPVILHHHEAMDGTGFPQKLPGDKINPLARIVAVANRYDNLVNPRGGAPSSPAQGEEPLTPHEALKRLYARERTKLDERLLSAFIRNLGVYPPGTIVRLSNGVMGMVVSTNPSKAARPSVLIHHAEIPKTEALIVDLAIETELEITATLRPEELPRDVFSYLSPSKQISYYAETLPE